MTETPPMLSPEERRQMVENIARKNLQPQQYLKEAGQPHEEQLTPPTPEVIDGQSTYVFSGVRSPWDVISVGSAILGGLLLLRIVVSFIQWPLDRALQDLEKWLLLDLFLFSDAIMTYVDSVRGPKTTRFALHDKKAHVVRYHGWHTFYHYLYEAGLIKFKYVGTREMYHFTQPGDQVELSYFPWKRNITKLKLFTDRQLHPIPMSQAVAEEFRVSRWEQWKLIGWIVLSVIAAWFVFQWFFA